MQLLNLKKQPYATEKSSPKVHSKREMFANANQSPLHINKLVTLFRSHTLL